MLSSDAEVSIHRQTETGTPTATSPISTGMMVQEQNGEIMPRSDCQQIAPNAFELGQLFLHSVGADIARAKKTKNMMIARIR